MTNQTTTKLTDRRVAKAVAQYEQVKVTATDPMEVLDAGKAVIQSLRAKYL